jgi:hypothetical protein
MKLDQYMEQRGYQHLVDDFFIEGVRQPILPDEAVLLPLSNLKADTSATTVYDLARADYGTFEGPVELYVWRQTDGSELEYVTVAGQAFERLRLSAEAARKRTHGFFMLLGGLGLLGAGFYLGRR